MRRKFIAGNWKMNLDRKAGVALAETVAHEAERSAKSIWPYPPQRLSGSGGTGAQGFESRLGRQNVYHQPNGALPVKSASRCSMTWA